MTEVKPDVNTTEAQIQRLNAENIEIKRRLGTLEGNDARHEQDIRELYKAQEGTKVYVTQILSKLEGLETRLFGLVTQLTTGQEKERKDDRKERSTSMDKWLDFAKFVIAATIGAIVLYLFQSNGGGK